MPLLRLFEKCATIAPTLRAPAVAAIMSDRAHAGIIAAAGALRVKVGISARRRKLAPIFYFRIQIVSAGESNQLGACTL